MQWHACQIAIQFRPRGIDDDALLKLDQIWILLMSYNLEIVTFDLNVTSGSHMLHGGKSLHAIQWFASQPRNMCMFL